jgi:hypothetical protein
MDAIVEFVVVFGTISQQNDTHGVRVAPEIRNIRFPMTAWKSRHASYDSRQEDT